MMTAVGRGRGNWGSKEPSAPLRRPGEVPRTGGGEDDTIMKELANLDINDNLKVEVVESQIKKYCVNREQLWKICQRMYEAGAKDRSMVPKVVKFWKKLCNFEVNDVKLRSVLMSTAQKDYEERETIRNDDPERFLNAVALFGGIFHNVTLPGGGIFNVLVSPMVEYLELLLKEASKDSKLREGELEMLATQVNLNGPLLQEQVKGTLDAFNCQVRDTLTMPAPSIRCQHWLLLVMDLTTQGWNVHDLPDYLKTYYSEKLGKSFDILVGDTYKRPTKLESIIPVNKMNADGPPMVPRKSEGSISSESSGASRDASHFGKAASEYRSRGDGDQRRKPAYWGHDDRFEDVDNSSGPPSRSRGFSERGGGGRRGGGGHWRGGYNEGGGGRRHNDDSQGGGRRRFNDDSNEGGGRKQPFPSMPPPQPITQEESWD
ncbi:uncharacterized protein LOC124165799 [Ischnura elegans]|uniref:uncharacterized protein LOC124165799 n=1 Tax=Ischnura elegans TaxID=197161 RepID=UPI001ED8893D|nr:uncharacterized protein LOC124165799 [Ischnura elegans]XP_046399275.1 uncharacterized protein LOC124165799 [Ischnura elegans]